MTSAVYPNDFAELKQHYHQNGFCILRSFFSKDDMPQLLDDILSAEPSEGQGGLSKGAMQFRSNLFYKSKNIQKFITQQKLVSLVQHIIGYDFWIRWDQAVGKGPNAPVFPWHQDNGYNELSCEHFQCWIAVTKSTSENGTIVISPKSHLNGRLPHTFDGRHTCYKGEVNHSTMIEAEPGDVLLFSSLMLHKTLPNISQSDVRWAYVLEFMSLNDYDPSVPKPYFVISKDGKPYGAFINQHPAKNMLIDIAFHLRKLIGPLRAAFKRLKELFHLHPIAS
ncbi:MAG: hypothetical protein B7X98_00150 [Methylophilaceae bacterium 17-43-7]|nr:MAG: hypothetical protein B7X98_00150 [Methylophilaceae bacterium 17-43-7]